MTEERFLRAKKSLVSLMEKEGRHCAESIEFVKKTSSVKELSVIFDVFLNEAVRKDFPSADFFREYFGNDLEELQEYGIYFDHVGDVVANRRVLHILGNSVISLKIEDLSVHRINVSHYSHVFLYACDYSIVRIRKAESSRVDVIESTKTSRILIR